MSSLGTSALLHTFGVIAVAAISFPPPAARPSEPRALAHPTEIRIHDRLYYVHDILPPSKENKEPLRHQAAQAKASVNPRPAEKTPLPSPPHSLARVFVPPELRRPNPTSEITLIQPDSVPDIPPKNLQLPTMKVWIAEIPEIRKQYVAPGQKTPLPDHVDVLPPPPDFDLPHAAPLPSAPEARLNLPPMPPPVVDTRPAKTDRESSPVPVGDPVNVISLNNRVVAIEEKLVVPPGNVFGKNGEAVAASSARVEAAHSSPDPYAAPTASTSADRRKTPSTTSGPITTVGLASANPSVRGGKGSSTGRQVIIRPADGRFDAIVVQSSPLDQFPEGKTLLTGRPIYTVYISLGTPKDWAMYFCVPNEKQRTEAGGNIVKIESAPPVRAPYPTRLIQPDVNIPSYQKYILVHGFITDSGRFESLRVVRSINPETDAILIASLSDWEFRPTTKDGVKIPVEFLLSIPVAGL